MADQTILVTPGGSGLKFDLTELTVGANTVERERVNISDPSDAAGFAKVENTTPGASDYGVVTRNIPSGTQTVAGTVTANIGTSGSLALDASVTGLQVAQGSTTSGEKGSLVQGAVTTAAPTYTTAQTSPLSLTTAGAVRVDGSGVTQPVSGTVTANGLANLQVRNASNTWTDIGYFTGDLNVPTQDAAGQAPGSNAPVWAVQIGGSDYGGTAHTQVVKVDSSGNLYTDVTNTVAANITQAAGVNLSGQVAGSLPVTIVSGAGSGGTAIADEAAFTEGTTSFTPIGGEFKTSSTNLTSGQAGIARMTNDRNLMVDVEKFGGTAVATGTGTGGAGIPRVTVSSDSSITANAGTNLNTSALALDTSVAGVLVAQASTTSGEKGPLVQGAVTTNAPTYTTAQTNPLSLDTSGLLRVSLKDTPQNTTAIKVDGSAVTQPVSGTVALAAGSAVIGHVITDSGSVTNATLSAETTKVIGVVRTSDGAGNLLTSNSTTPAAKFALDQNITSILGTAPTTVGKLDVKGADGDLFVRQTAAANLNATVVGTLTNNNAAPSTTNLGVLPAVATATAPSLTQGDQVLLSTDLAGNLRTNGTAIIGANSPISAAVVSGIGPNATVTALAVDPAGAMSVSPSSNIQDLLYQLILETRATRMAIIASNCASSVGWTDFNVSDFESQVN